MKIKIGNYVMEISTGNAAFQDGNKQAELSRINKVINEKIEAGHTSGKVMDINGNSVGTWEKRGRN